MNARFPIYAKVLTWFFVNLAVLGCAGWLLVRHQFRLSAFTIGVAHDRVEGVVGRIADELSASPVSKWNGILAAHEGSLGVELYCYAQDGRMLAGRRSKLPPQVHTRLGGRPRGQPDNGMRPERPRPPRGPPDDLLRGRLPGGPDGLPEGREDFPAFDDRGPDSRPLRARPDFQALRDEVRNLVQTEDPVRYWVLIRRALRIDGRDVPGVIITASDSPTGHGLYFDYRPIAWACAGVLVLSALIWFPFVRGLTRSVGRLRDATGELAEGHFDVRVNEARRDEVGELGAEINRMAQRLAGFVDGQRRFLSDVAHELSAPTARLQLAVSVLEQRASEADRARLQDVREEVEHMAGLVNELLEFSRASIGGRQPELHPVSVREAAETAIRREAGDPSGVMLVIQEELTVRADRELLQRALSNLIRNAIRYAGHAGNITVSAVRENGCVLLSVADCGPGVPPDALAKIFDPLYRMDTARTHDGGGIGLGLAIVKTCVEACGGSVGARNLLPSGLEVTITLPEA